MKRLIAVALALLMLVAMVPTSLFGLIASAADPVTVTIYANGTYTGSDSDGSEAKPFRNLNTAFYYLSKLKGVDQAVILITGDTALGAVVKEDAKADGKYQYYSQTTTNITDGQKITNMLNLAAMPMPVTIRGAGGKISQAINSRMDLVDPIFAEREKVNKVKEAHFVFYIRSELTFDHIQIDTVYDYLFFRATNSVSLTVNDDVVVNNATDSNVTIELNRIGNTLNLFGGTFGCVTVDNAGNNENTASSVINIGSNARVYTYYGSGDTKTAVINMTGGYIGTMFLGGERYAAKGFRTLNMSGGSVDVMYLGGAVEKESTAEYTVNLSGGEISLLYPTGITKDSKTACTGKKTVNAYDGYLYAITEKALPGFDVRNELRSNPPSGEAGKITMYVGDEGDDANSGMTSELKLKTLEKAMSKAVGLYNRDVASSVVIQIVGNVTLPEMNGNFVSPVYNFPLTIRGGMITTKSNNPITHYYANSATSFDLIMQGPITWQDVTISAANYAHVVLFAQNYAANMVHSDFNAAYEMIVDNVSFVSKTSSYIYSGRNVDLHVMNGTYGYIIGGKNMYLSDVKVRSFTAGNAPYGGGKIDSINIVLKNSTLNAAFGSYKVPAAKVTYRLEKGSNITGYIRSSYSGGGTTNAYVDEFNVVFAGGTVSGSLEGKGDAYYRNNGSVSGQTGVSKVIVDGNVGAKYAPAQSKAVDFDSWEVINFNESVRETVYVNPAYVGESDGSQAKPFTNMEDAFRNFVDYGEVGTIILLSNTTLNANDLGFYETNAFYETVTITSNKKATLFVKADTAEAVLSLLGPVQYKNITLDTVAATAGNTKPTLTIVANGNNLIMGSGCTMSAATTVIGGASDSNVRTTNLMLYSGKYAMVVGGGIHGEVSGIVNVTFNGANADVVVGGGLYGNVSGGTNLMVENGVIGSVYAGNYYEGTTSSSTLLLRNKNCKINNLLTANRVDGLESGVMGIVEVAKLGSSKLPATQNVIGVSKIINTTKITIYVNGSTKITDGNGTKEKPFCSLMNAFYYLSNYEKQAGVLYDGATIVITGRTEMAENRLNKMYSACHSYIRTSESLYSTDKIKQLNSTITTPTVKKPVLVKGSGRGVLATDALKKYEYANGSVYEFVNDARTYTPSVNLTYKNINYEQNCFRFHYYPAKDVSTYFANTFNRTGNATYMRHGGGVGSKMMVFGGTWNYIAAGYLGYGELIVGGDARVTRFLAGSFGCSTFDIKMEVLGGNIAAIYGGTWTGTTTHTGNVRITVVGGTVGKIYGGSYVDTVLDGKVTVALGGGIISGQLDGNSLKGGKVTGSRTLNYTVDYAVKARSAVNFTKMKLVDRVAATGDDGAIVIWTSILVLTVAMAAALIMFKRKKTYTI